MVGLCFGLDPFALVTITTIRRTFLEVEPLKEGVGVNEQHPRDICPDKMGKQFSPIKV